MRYKYHFLALLLTIVSFGAINQAIAQQSSTLSNQAVVAVNQAIRDIEMSSLSSDQNHSWIFIGQSVKGFNYYLNVDTIKNFNQYEALIYPNNNLDFAETHTRAWWRVVRTNGDYDKIQTKFYCSKNASINVIGVMYSKDDDFLGNLKINKYVEPIIPGTVHSEISKQVCELS